MKILLLLLITVIPASCGKTNAPGYSKKFLKYRAATAEERTIQISLWDQKAWLLNGEGEAILDAFNMGWCRDARGEIQEENTLQLRVHSGV